MLSPRLEKLFAGKHAVDLSLVRELSPDEVEVVRQAVRGQRESTNRIRALAILAATDAPDAASVLGEVILNPEEDVGVRAAAVVQVGRAGGPAAGKVLADCLIHVREAGLRARIAAELARLGSDAGGDDVKDQKGRSQTSAVSDSFAQLLAAHVKGASGVAIPSPADGDLLAPSTDLVPIRIQHRDPDELKPITASPEVRSFGVALSTTLGFGMKCGPHDYHLLINTAIEAEKNPAQLILRRPLVFGLLVERLPEDGSHAVRGIVLLGPAGGDRFYIALYQPGGTLVHYGWGQVKGSAATFEVRSLKLSGNVAVDIRGSARGSEIEFTEFRVGLSVVPRKIPRSSATVS